MKMKEYTDIMIDIESLGNEGNFVVTQIALVPFTMTDDNDLEILKQHSFVEGISVASSIDKGFKVDSNTIEWWIKTDVKMLSTQFLHKKSVKEVCYNIEQYLSRLPNVKRFWATATLDYQALSNIFKSVEMENPFRYNKRFCARTIRLLAESKGNKYTNENSHDAFEDCVIQIDKLKEQLNTVNIVF